MKKSKIRNKRGKNRNPFAESWNYIKESKNYILFAALVFVIFLAIAMIFPTPKFLESQLNAILKQLVEQTSGLTGLQLVIFILRNNISVSAAGVFFGALIGIVPFVVALSNGYVLGYVFKIVINNGGIGSLWKILPHGIFELPAILISLGLGLKLGTSFFIKKPGKEFLRRLLLSIKVFIFIIIPLLIIAAIIEGVLIKLLG